MKKKLLCIILTLALVLGLAACGGNKAATPNYRMDGKVMELTIPALPKAQEQVYQAGSNATQAQHAILSHSKYSIVY